MKKLLVLMLALTMVLSSVSVNAVTTTDPVQAFTDGAFDMTNQNEFVDLLMLYVELTDTAAFSQAYENAFNELATGQQARLEGFGVTLSAVDAFGAFVDGDVFSEATLREYLDEDPSDDEGVDGDKAMFTAAIDRRKVEFETALADAGADVTAIEDGFERVDLIFSYLNLYTASPFDLFRISTTGTMTVNTTDVEDAVTLANGILTDDIEDTTTLIAGLNDFAAYYNAANSSDKGAVKTYLKLYGLATEAVTPVDPVDPVDPEPEEPTDPETEENAQDAVEEEATVEVEATTTTTEDGTVVATVEVDDETLDDAIASAVEAVENVEADETVNDDQVVETIVVLEVTSTEDSDVQEVSIPLDALVDAENDAENPIDGVTIKSESGSVTFDTEALVEEGAAIEEGTTVEVAMETVDASEVTLPAGTPEDVVIIDFSINLVTEDAQGNEVKTEVESFTKPILVKVPYTLKDGEDPDAVTVYFLAEDGTATPIGGRYNATTGMVEFYTNHFSKYYAAPAVVKTFSDVTVHWAKDYIEKLASKGFINGKTAETFVPEADITRAEFVAIVARMYQLKGNVEALTFTDVPADAWYAEEVAAAYQAGIINGKGNNLFAPMAKITRQEAAVVISNTLQYANFKLVTDRSDIKAAFSDFGIVANWAADGLATAYKKEIIGGKPGGIFDPLGNTTRAEVAKMLFTLYNVK